MWRNCSIAVRRTDSVFKRLNNLRLSRNSTDLWLSARVDAIAILNDYQWSTMIHIEGHLSTQFADVPTTAVKCATYAERRDDRTQSAGRSQEGINSNCLEGGPKPGPNMRDPTEGRRCHVSTRRAKVSARNTFPPK